MTTSKIIKKGFPKGEHILFNTFSIVSILVKLMSMSQPPPLLQIYPGLTGLGVLEGAFDVVVFAVFNEVGAGLFEPGGYLFFFAYAAEFHYLVEVAGADFIARLAACYYLFHPLTYVVGCKIDALQQRFANDDFVPDVGKLMIYRGFGG